MTLTPTTTRSEAILLTKLMEALEPKFQQIQEMETRIPALIKQDIDSKLQGIMIELQEVKKSMNFMGNQFDEMKAENEQLKLELSTIKKQQIETNKMMEENQHKLNDNVARTNEMDNFMRFNTLEIHGVPYQEGENIDNISMNILKVVDDDITPKHVQSSFRTKSINSKSGIIITKLASREKRIDIFRKKKKLAGFDFKRIGLNTNQVFINENLCQATKYLFFKANQLRKQHAWKSIWTYNGVIKLKRNENSSIVSIKNENDLSKIN